MLRRHQLVADAVEVEVDPLPLHPQSINDRKSFLWVRATLLPLVPGADAAQLLLLLSVSMSRTGRELLLNHSYNFTLDLDSSEILTAA